VCHTGGLIIFEGFFFLFLVIAMDLSIDTFHATLLTTATTMIVFIAHDDESPVVALPNPTQHSYFPSRLST